MTNVFDELKAAISEAQLEIGEGEKQGLFLPPIPNGQYNLLRMVLLNAEGLRRGGWHVDRYAEICIEEDNMTGIQTLKQHLFDAIDTTYEAFANAIMINSDGLPALLYDRIEPITGNAEYPESGIKYALIELLLDEQRHEYIDCSITALFVPDRKIVPQKDSEAEYRGLTEEDLNSPKLASDNELTIMSAGYPTGNCLPSDDYVGKKLHSLVFFGDEGSEFLKKLGLFDVLIKNVQAAAPKQLPAQDVPLKLTM